MHFAGYASGAHAGNFVSKPHLSLHDQRTHQLMCMVAFPMQNATDASQKAVVAAASEGTHKY